jgi:hypothetical protein
MRRPEVGILALALLSACAIPTDAPNWDTTWNLPVPDKGSLNIPIASFLPSGVTVAAGTPATFSVQVASSPPISRSLGANCPACPNATAQKPSFTAPLATSSVSLTAAANLTSAVLATGSQLVVAINNGYTFDPINPPGGAAGSVSITVSNNNLNIGGPTVLTGGTATIKAGQITNVTIPLSGTIVSSSPITVAMTMVSPAGSAAQPVTMNSAQLFTASMTPTLNMSSATVAIPAQPISGQGSPIDLSNMDQKIINRVADTTATEGTLYLQVTNPLTLGASASIRLASPAGSLTPIVPVVKNFTLAAAANASTPNASTIAVNLTGHELRSILGENLVVTFGGTTAAGSTVVTPTQKIAVSSRLQFTLSIREQ